MYSMISPLGHIFAGWTGMILAWGVFFFFLFRIVRI